MNHGPLVSDLIDAILNDEDEDDLATDSKNNSPALKQRVSLLSIALKVLHVFRKYYRAFD